MVKVTLFPSLFAAAAMAQNLCTDSSGAIVTVSGPTSLKPSSSVELTWTANSQDSLDPQTVSIFNVATQAVVGTIGSTTGSSNNNNGAYLGTIDFGPLGSGPSGTYAFVVNFGDSDAFGNMQPNFQCLTNSFTFAGSAAPPTTAPTTQAAPPTTAPTTQAAPPTTAPTTKAAPPTTVPTTTQAAAPTTTQAAAPTTTQAAPTSAAPTSAATTSAADSVAATTQAAAASVIPTAYVAMPPVVSSYKATAINLYSAASSSASYVGAAGAGILVLIL
ncbi:hypothetical protein HDU98_000554 [Podochytrium sp. JEL0797]|nr:hypothetical protein HDU98_000554 [Podochytrium sp. JEL0797]